MFYKLKGCFCPKHDAKTTPWEELHRWSCILIFKIATDEIDKKVSALPPKLVLAQTLALTDFTFFNATTCPVCAHMKLQGLNIKLSTASDMLSLWTAKDMQCTGAVWVGCISCSFDLVEGMWHCMLTSLQRKFGPQSSLGCTKALLVYTWSSIPQYWSRACTEFQTICVIWNCWLTSPSYEQPCTQPQRCPLQGLLPGCTDPFRQVCF